MSMQLQEQLQAKTTRYLLLLLPLVLTVQLFPFVLNSLSSQQKTLFTPIDESTCFSLVELHDLIRAFRTFYSEPLNKVGTIYSNLRTCKALKSQAFEKKNYIKNPRSHFKELGLWFSNHEFSLVELDLQLSNFDSLASNFQFFNSTFQFLSRSTKNLTFNHTKNLNKPKLMT